jgi:hypothetical protein
MNCPGCGRVFETVGGLDTHRRHPRAGQDCRYRPGSPRLGFHPGRLVRSSAEYWRTTPSPRLT